MNIEDFKRSCWTQADFAQLGQALQQAAEPAYRTFNDKIVKPVLPMLGIRAPHLRKLAAAIAKGDAEGFLSACPADLYEWVLLRGMVLGRLRGPFARLLELTDGYIPLISDWALCDMTATGLKQFAKPAHRQDGFAYAAGCVGGDNPWRVRFGLVLLLAHDVDEQHLAEIFRLCIAADRLRFPFSQPVKERMPDEGYVKMAIGWLISVCYVRFPSETDAFLRDCPLGDAAYNLAVRKIIESRRVDKRDKERLKKQKRKAVIQ